MHWILSVKYVRLYALTFNKKNMHCMTKPPEVVFMATLEADISGMVGPSA